MENMEEIQAKVWELLMNAAADGLSYDQAMNGIGDSLDLTDQQYNKCWYHFHDEWSWMVLYAKHH